MNDDLRSPIAIRAVRCIVVLNVGELVEVLVDFVLQYTFAYSVYQHDFPEALVHGFTYKAAAPSHLVLEDLAIAHVGVVVEQFMDM